MKPRVKLIAQRASHITRALIASLQSEGREVVDERYVQSAEPGIESQQLDSHHRETFHAEVADRMAELQDTTMFTGGTQLYVLTDGMYTSADPYQHALLASLVQTASAGRPVQAVLVDPDEEPVVEQNTDGAVDPAVLVEAKDASNSALESYLGDHGIRLVRRTTA